MTLLHIYRRITTPSRTVVNKSVQRVHRHRYLSLTRHLLLIMSISLNNGTLTFSSTSSLSTTTSPAATASTTSSTATSPTKHDVDDILSFWFADGPIYADQTFTSEQAEKDRIAMWFNGGIEVDDACRQHADKHFDRLQQNPQYLQQMCELSDDGYVAAILLCDQLARNAYRGTNQAFQYTEHALHATRALVKSGGDMKYCEHSAKMFVYMPLLHSEDINDAELSIQVFDKKANGKPDQFAHSHYDVIKKFGRYPSRNAAMGRESTPEEIEHLKTTTNGWEKSQIGKV